MNEEQLTKISRILGVQFKNTTLISTALTHRSYLNENKSHSSEHNERLEFLGDAVLELIISEYLFNTYPDRPEGELTSFRAATVKTETLASISRQLGLGEFLQMSKGEDATGGKDKDYLLANAFEAVLGAIYLDQGYDICQNFIYTNFLETINYIVANRLDIDAKTKFQELAQSIYKVTPTYKLVKESGPDHEKEFTMGVYVESKEFGRGSGSSKQKAEEQAAQNALIYLEKLGTEANIA